MTDASERTPANRTPPLPDEAAVIALAAGGDRTAFTQLMEHYQSACYGLAWRLLSDADQAADATQDAFMHAYRAIGSYRGGVFRSWLLRITANASYDILRRQQRRPSSPLPDPEEGAPELPDLSAVNPVAEATKSELYRHLEVALRRLPEDQRTAVVLCDVYGMDYNEVAAMTQSALGTVKSRIHRGRLRLRALMAEHRELFTDEDVWSGGMLIPNHPDDERLSALASHDDDATTDAALTAHVSSCNRCTEIVTDLGALRASLADLPDVAPSRPLRLLPPVADAPAAGSAGDWIRRLFAPAMTAGAALAMVGLIGTAGPALQGAASSGRDIFQDAGSEIGGEAASSFAQELRSSDGAEEAPTDVGAPAAAQQSPGATAGDGGGRPLDRSAAPVTSGEGDDEGRTPLPAERSPWPMVLFTGVALMVAAALLRWILVPRAG